MHARPAPTVRPAPEPGPASADAALAALALAGLALWLALPDKTFVFDGMIFAQVVERSIVEWRDELLNTRHLLFNPSFQLLRDGLAACGLSVGAYRLFQVVNALAGAVGLLLFGRLARRLSGDAALGWCAALLLGATLSYGTRATEGQAYMLMSLGAIAVLWSAARLLDEPSPRAAASLIAISALGPLLHAADAFLLPAAAYALLRAFPARRGAAAAAAAAVPAALVAVYLAVFGGAGWRYFLGHSADVNVPASAGLGAGLLAFFSGAGGASAPARLALVWRETGAGIAPLPGAAAAAAGLALWLAAAGAAAAAWPGLSAARRSTAAAIALAWAGFTFVNVFWPGGPFFYVPAHACALALLALAAGPRWAVLPPATRRRALGALAAAGLALAAENVRAGLLPQSRVENNRGYSAALFVRDHTLASSVIVITGFGFPNSKVYLPYFARRNREVLEYYFDRLPKDEALRKLSSFADAMIAHGLPMYFLSDMVEGPSAFAQMRRLWGVDMADVQNAFGPGRVVRAAASPFERVYLFAPAGREAPTLAVLGYAAVTHPDETLADETLNAVREIARGTSPAERRRAAALLRATNWGYDAFWSAVAPTLHSPTQAELRERAEGFADYQRSDRFKARAAELLKALSGTGAPAGRAASR